MGLVSRAKQGLELLPPEIRLPIERAVAVLPREFLYGKSFRQTRRLIEQTEQLDPQTLQKWQDARLSSLLDYCYTRVPFYRESLVRAGFPSTKYSPRDVLRGMPLLSKSELEANADQLLAKEVSGWKREQVSTGGTSGTPVRFWIDRGRSPIEWAFMTWQWGRVGFRIGDRRVVLRGAAVPKGKAGEFSVEHPLLDELVLSTFALSPSTVERFAEKITRYGPAFLHAYASSAEHLSKLLVETGYANRIGFRGVLLGSENVYPSQVELIEKEFNCRVFCWYGHSEKCLLGGWCEYSQDYHLFPQYGYLEVVREDGSLCEPGERGFLCGTSFINNVMPFLRYVTDDTAVLADGPCKCGLPYPRVREIVGRWYGEVLYGRGERKFTMTALNTHSAAFNRVRQFRLRQERVGEVTVEVVPGVGFSHTDLLAIEREYGERSGRSIDFKVVTVHELPRTARGKFKFVDQRIVEVARDPRSS